MKGLIALLLILLAYCTTTTRANPFPDDWLGVWKGDVYIHATSGHKDTIQMELHIKEISDTSWTWSIIYITERGRQDRNYELYRQSDSPHYLLDEKNSIELYLSYINDGFYSVFEVMGSQIMVSYEMIDSNVEFRIVSWKAEGIESGGEDEIPLVTAFKTTDTQFGRLQKE